MWRANASGIAAIRCVAAGNCRHRAIITTGRRRIAGATTSDASEGCGCAIRNPLQQSSQWRHTIAHPIPLSRHQMNKSMAALALIALCSTAQASPASDADDGFLTGKFFRDGSQSMRAAYVIGILDGFSYATVFGAPDAKIEKLRRCISGMNANTGKSAPSSISTSTRTLSHGARGCNRLSCAQCGRLARLMG